MKTSVIGSTLLGMISFAISGTVACFLILFADEYILATAIAGGLGGLLLGVFARMGPKIFKMTIAGAAAMLLGLVLSFLIVEGAGELFLSGSAEWMNSSIPDIIAIALMGILAGAAMGIAMDGRKAALLYSAVCGVASIPFGFLVAAFNSGYRFPFWPEDPANILAKLDVNFLTISIALGFGIGLSAGLYKMMMGKGTKSKTLRGE